MPQKDDRERLVASEPMIVTTVPVTDKIGEIGGHQPGKTVEYIPGLHVRNNSRN